MTTAPADQTAYIIDASALAAIVFGEAEGADLLALIGDAALAAPSLLPIEMASVGLKKLRRDKIGLPAVEAAMARVARLSIGLWDIPGDAVFRTAAANNLSAYDACYLWLARSRGLPLMTLDAALARAAAQPAASP